MTIWIAMAALAICQGGCQKKTAAPDTVAINGHVWQVELAVTDAQQAEGLAHRASIPAGRGMIFIYRDAELRTFWMRGCEMRIDIAFIDADLKVVNIEKMYPEPGKPEEELTIYHSSGPAQFALEAGGGELERAGVKPGQRVELSEGILRAARRP